MFTSLPGNRWTKTASCIRMSPDLIRKWECGITLGVLFSNGPFPNPYSCAFCRHLIRSATPLLSARSLDDVDVKLDAPPSRLEIHESKFRKSRLVPLHPTTSEKLRHYAQVRAQLGYEGCSAFFASERRKHLCYETLRSWFARTTWELGMRPEDGRRPPTLHGLRHYFAVERLTLWCQHLISTPALLTTAGDSFQHYATPGGDS